MRLSAMELTVADKSRCATAILRRLVAKGHEEGMPFLGGEPVDPFLQRAWQKLEASGLAVHGESGYQARIVQATLNHGPDTPPTQLQPTA